MEKTIVLTTIQNSTFKSICLNYWYESNGKKICISEFGGEYKYHRDEDFQCKDKCDEGFDIYSNNVCIKCYLTFETCYGIGSEEKGHKCTKCKEKLEGIKLYNVENNNYNCRSKEEMNNTNYCFNEDEMNSTFKPFGNIYWYYNDAINKYKFCINSCGESKFNIKGEYQCIALCDSNYYIDDNECKKSRNAMVLEIKNLVICVLYA